MPPILLMLVLGQTEAYELGAKGAELLVQGDPAAALSLLERAHALAPEDFVIARDLAAAALRADRPSDALRAVDRAIELGDPDPEARELRAVILARLGRRRTAAEVASEIGTVEGHMIGAVLSDPEAAYRLMPLVGEQSDRGALASLVLAAHEAARGDMGGARRLSALAEHQATAAEDITLLNAARGLSRRFEEAGAVRHLLRLRLGLDHATNPGYVTAGDPDRNSGLRAVFSGDGAVEIPLGRATLFGGIRLEQHAFANQRELYASLDLTALSISTRVDVAISNHPSAAIVGFSTRYTDVFARLFREHYAASIEGGPDLTIKLNAPMRLRLAVYGVATDFVDVSPPSGTVGSVNRDRVGQRAVLSLLLRTDWIEGIAEGLFLHDDARGDAFDAIGGGIAGRVAAHLSGGIVLFTGIAVTVREYGPVGDRAIIGPASTRAEIRTVAELGARVPLYRFGDTPGLFFVMEDVWINNAARQEHGYTENVLSMGVEVSF